MRRGLAWMLALTLLVGGVAGVGKSALLEYVFHASPVWVFVVGILAIVPLAEWIRRATEHLAVRAGSEGHHPLDRNHK